MNWSKVWFSLSLLGLASLIFLLGWAFGNRTWTSVNQPLELNITHWNGAVANDLSKIRSTTLLARASESEVKNVGSVTLLPSKASLQILVSFNGIPSSFNTTDKQFATPRTLTMYKAVRTTDGQKYTLESVGIVTLEQQESSLAGKFPTTIKIQPTDPKIERFLFVSEAGTSELPPSPLEFLPESLKSQNAPYAWSDVLVY